MSTIEEVQKPMVEQGEKKAKAAPKKAKAMKTASHPPYFEMIKDALLALKEKGGSSPHAIAKYMEEKHKAELPANFRKILGLQLKNSAAKGKLIKIKASYKLSESGKKDKAVAGKPTEKKAVAAKPAAKKRAAAKPAPKKTAAAKPASKRTAAAKPASKRTVAEKKTATAKPAAKKTTAAVTKKPKASAGTKRKAEAVKKKPVAKKAVTKKATPVKAKQPKSIKSPAAKRAKRASAAV